MQFNESSNLCLLTLNIHLNEMKFNNFLDLIIFNYNYDIFAIKMIDEQIENVLNKLQCL